MDKEFIISELQRITVEDGGTVPGSKKFSDRTGIRSADWLGKHWARWGDAVAEAGLQPNEFKGAFPENHLLLNYCQLAAKIGRIPTNNELKLEARAVSSFPSHTTFARLGKLSERLPKVAVFARENGFPAVAELCESATLTVPKEKPAKPSDEVFGFVYLIKSGRFYKIGKSNSVGRRERELAIQLPEESKTVHAIRTDDPLGIEAYWHRRFADKRQNGEWFKLNADDVRAFRRRKFM